MDFFSAIMHPNKAAKTNTVASSSSLEGCTEKKHTKSEGFPYFLKVWIALSNVNFLIGIDTASASFYSTKVQCPGSYSRQAKLELARQQWIQSGHTLSGEDNDLDKINGLIQVEVKLHVKEVRSSISDDMNGSNDSVVEFIAHDLTVLYSQRQFEKKIQAGFTDIVIKDSSHLSCNLLNKNVILQLQCKSRPIVTFKIVEPLSRHYLHTVADSELTCKLDYVYLALQPQLVERLIMLYESTSRIQEQTPGLTKKNNKNDSWDLQEWFQRAQHFKDKPIASKMSLNVQKINIDLLCNHTPGGENVSSVLGCITFSNSHLDVIRQNEEERERCSIFSGFVEGFSVTQEQSLGVHANHQEFISAINPHRGIR